MCKLDVGKRSFGGQKRWWNDVIVGDLKKCQVYPNWREKAQDCSIRHGWIKAGAEDLNEEILCLLLVNSLPNLLQLILLALLCDVHLLVQIFISMEVQ